MLKLLKPLTQFEQYINEHITIRLSHNIDYKIYKVFTLLFEKDVILQSIIYERKTVIR